MIFSPIHDLKHLLSPKGVLFIDRTLSAHCKLTNTCHKSLRVLNARNAAKITDEIKRRFYEAYRDTCEINQVDAFVCFHPSAMCELYMKFNRSLIVIATTRYEIERNSAIEWNNWNENLKIIASDPKNVIAANNLYDAEYIRYFTGINATVLPNFCGYTNTIYQPVRQSFLIAPIHSKKFEKLFLQDIRNGLSQHRFQHLRITPLRVLYPNYKYSDVASHSGIIHIPYQVSIMSLFEQYRMNIPLFFPSQELLSMWHNEHMVISERTIDFSINGHRPNRSQISGVLDDIPDPNNEFDVQGIRYWLKFSDFYQWPHIVYFDSVDDLLEKLLKTDLQKVSENMATYNKQVRFKLEFEWENILNRIRQHSQKFRRFSE